MSTPLSLKALTINELLAAGGDDMLALHWEEVEDEHEKVPLAINWAAFRDLERRGVLKIYGLFRGARLIGYSGWFVQPVLHHMLTTWAVCDLIYVEPEERRGWAGVKLVKDSVKQVTAAGAKVVMINTKPGLDSNDLGYKRGRDSLAALLKRLGFRKSEETWAYYV